MKYKIAKVIQAMKDMECFYRSKPCYPTCNASHCQDIVDYLEGKPVRPKPPKVPEYLFKNNHKMMR